MKNAHALSEATTYSDTFSRKAGDDFSSSTDYLASFGLFSEFGDEIDALFEDDAHARPASLKAVPLKRVA
jgi:hypothetical protein